MSMFADAYISSLGYLCYNEPLFNGLADAGTKISCNWLISIVKSVY